MSRISVIFITVRVLFFLSAFAQKPQINNIYTYSGKSFPDDDILAVTEDAHGFIWAISPSSIMRYDGAGFVSIDPHLLEQITKGNNPITSIVNTPRNILGVGTRKGLFLYDLVNQSVKFSETLSGIRILGMLCDEFGNIWLNTASGLYVYSVALDRSMLITRPGDRNFEGYLYSTLSLDARGNLLYAGRKAIVAITTRQGVFNHDVFASDVPLEFSEVEKCSNHVRIQIDKWNYLWMWYRGKLDVRKLNPDNTLQARSIYSSSNAEISTVYHDPDDRTWVGIRGLGYLILQRDSTGAVTNSISQSFSNQNGKNG